MIITTDYRLEKQGGYYFRADKREWKMPDMRGSVDSTRVAQAKNDRYKGRENNDEDKTAEVREMQANPS